MRRNGIEDFGPYQDAGQLFDHVVTDMQMLRGDSRCHRLVGQQVASADSICANMEEGFGRLSRKEFIRFLDIARGSARETLGRYRRMKHWLPSEIVSARVDLADRIIGKLTKSIITLRATVTQQERAVHEEAGTYGDPQPAEFREVSQDEVEALVRAQ